MVAEWAGPRHAFQIVEGLGEMALDRVSDEFLALWNALTSPHRVVSRHYTVTTVPEGLGYRLGLQPIDKVPGQPTFSDNYRDIDAMRHDVNALTAMLTYADWKAYSEEGARELLFIKHLLKELGIDIEPTILTDSLGSLQIANDPVQHWKLKHIDTQYYSLRDSAVRHASMVKACRYSMRGLTEHSP